MNFSFSGSIVRPLAVSATLLLVILSTSYFGDSSDDDTSATLLIENVHILDTERYETFFKGELLIEQGVITRIFKDENEKMVMKPDWVRVDGRGGFLIPGIVNAHTHMFRAGYCGKDEGIAFENVRHIPYNFKVALAYGATTVVDLGGPLKGAVAIRTYIDNHPEIAAPRLYLAGPILTAKRGYPFDWAPRHLLERLQIAREVETSDEARSIVAELVRAGVDLVKIAAMEVGYNEHPIALISEEIIIALVGEAHRFGLKVFVHAHTAAGYRRAVRAGADIIAHSSFEALPEVLIREVVEKGIIVIPTLWVFSAFLQVQENPGLLDRLTEQLLPTLGEALLDFQRRSRELLGVDRIPDDFQSDLHPSRLKTLMVNARTNLLSLRKNGAKLALGTDASYCYSLQGSIWDELNELGDAGIPPAELLRIATRGAAETIGQENVIGRIAPGAIADLLIVAENPLEADRFHPPTVVISRGRLIRTARPVPVPGILETLQWTWQLLPMLFSAIFCS